MTRDADRDDAEQPSEDGSPVEESASEAGGADGEGPLGSEAVRGSESVPDAPDDGVEYVPADVREPAVPDPGPAAEDARAEPRRAGREHDREIPTGSVRERVVADLREHFDAAGDDGLDVPDDAFLESDFFDFDYLEDCREIEHYWVNEPFAFVSIVYDEDAREYQYRLVEASLDEFEAYVRADFENVLRETLLYQDVDPDESRAEVFDRRVTELLAEYGGDVAAGILQKLRYYLTRDFVGHGEIDPVMRDPAVEDLSCVGPQVPVFVYHRNYRDLATDLTFDRERLTSFVTRLAQRCGKHVSIADPLLDATMPDGSRVQLTLGSEVSSRGSNFTVRKFADVPYTPVDLLRWNTASPAMMAYLWLAIQNDMSVLFAGGTASGKTTTMNATGFFIPPNSKVVSIEDTREITLPHDNWIQSVTREAAGGSDRGEIGMYRLLRAGLRQRPEYLLVGEVRTDPDVALTFFQSISTGHTGYTTFHADGIETVLDRLTNPPLSVPKQMVRALDVVVLQRQAFIGNKRVRRTTELVEVTRVDGDPDAIGANRVYSWNAAEDSFEDVGTPRVFDRIAELRGWSEERVREEFEIRKRLLEYLLESGVTDHDAVAGTIHAFARDPETVTTALENGTLDPEEYA